MSNPEISGPSVPGSGTMELFGKEKTTANMVAWGLGLLAAGVAASIILPYVVTIVWNMVSIAMAVGILGTVWFAAPYVMQLMQFAFYSAFRWAWRKIIPFNFKAAMDYVLARIEERIARAREGLNKVKGGIKKNEERLQDEEKELKDATQKLGIARDALSAGGEAAERARAELLIQGQRVELRTASIKKLKSLLEQMRGIARILGKAVQRGELSKEMTSDRMNAKLREHEFIKDGAEAFEALDSLKNDPETRRQLEDLAYALNEDVKAELGVLDSLLDGTDNLEAGIDIENEVSVRRALAYLEERESDLDTVGASSTVPQITDGGGSSMSALDRALRERASSQGVAKKL